jgi:hypothetical protein
MLEDLRALVEFAHASSIAGAADRLFRTPSIRSKEQYLAVMSSIIEAIGNPPIVELSRLTRSRPGRLLLKLDYLNPGFKDRNAMGIIEEAKLWCLAHRTNGG